MPLRRRQKLIEGEPSVLSRARHEAQFGNAAGDEGEFEASAESDAQEDSVTADAPADDGVAQPLSAEASEPALEEGLVSHARPMSPRSAEPVRGQLDRLAEQIRGLQQQLDALIARRSEAASETASQQVAAIVSAAEQSAAEIRASAEHDAATVRDRLLADVQVEVERIRTEAQADAARIRTEAHADAARLREQVVTEASAEIQAVCARLSEELQSAARTAIAGIAGGPRVTFATPAESHPSGSEAAQASAEPSEIRSDDPPAPDQRIASEVEEAVDELQNAAAVLEESLRHLRAIGGDEPVG